MRLNDKVALITGAGSGIGRAVAILFAEEGASVVAADLTGDSVRETVESISAAGGHAVALTGDVTDSADAERMVGAAVESFGKLDLVVNSAGLTSRHSSLERASPEEAWERVIEVNLKGTYMVSWYAVPSDGASRRRFDHQPGIHYGPRGLSGRNRRRLQSVSAVEGRRGPVHEDARGGQCTEEHPRELSLPGVHRDQPHEWSDIRPGNA